MSELYIGKEVYWRDPDDGISSGYYTVKGINGEVIVLENDSHTVAEAYLYEIDGGVYV